MLKRIILALAVTLPMSVFAQKFGVVDLISVYQAMPESKTMETAMLDASKKYETEFQQLREELDKLYAAFQAIADDKETPDAIKQRRLEEIQEKEQKVNQFRNTAQQDLDRLHGQLMEPIQQKMMEAVQTVGRDGGYTVIFPNEQSLLLYTGGDVVDVTDQVKAQLGLK